jgi:hypothetical protein
MAKVISEKTERLFTVELTEAEVQAIVDRLPGATWGSDSPIDKVRIVLENALAPPF